MLTIKMPSEVEDIISGLKAEGFDAYAVGGCVRDSLLGLTPNDWDICTSALVDDLKRYFKRIGLKTIDTGLKHGTVTVIAESGISYEVTTFRIDGGYTDSRRPNSVSFVKTIGEDLSRRDFTINAMAYNSDGLIDPLGGREDLSQGLIRCVGDPHLRFSEDALRILRALRFASVYDFSIETSTDAAIHKCKEGLKNISSERIRDELCKLLSGDGSKRILTDYLDVIGIIIPEIIGSEISYKGSARAVSEYDGDEISIKTALLLSHLQGENLETEISILNRLKYDNKTKNEVLMLLEKKNEQIPETLPAVLTRLKELGEEGLRKLVVFQFAKEKAAGNRCKAGAHVTAVSNLMWKAVTGGHCYSLKDLAVSGEDLINSCGFSGEKIGQALNYLLDRVICGELENRRQALLNEAMNLVKDRNIE